MIQKSDRRVRAAGSETVGTSLQMLVLCMVLHPKVQKKAQAEIDAVCGGRLPDFSDYDQLLYVRAVVKETMRWLPVLRLSKFSFYAWISITSADSICKMPHTG